MSRKIGITFFLLAVAFLAVFTVLRGPFSIDSIEAQVLTPEQRAALEAESKRVEAEIAAAQADLESQQAKSASLSKDIAVLDAKIKVAQLNIKAKNLQIESLGKDITKKVAYIGVLDDRIERGKETLAQIMRKTSEVDSYSIAELMLSQNTITGFFQDIDDFESVQSGLRTTFEQIRSDKTETETEKSTLEKRKNAESDAKYAIEQEKKSVEANNKEKQRLLTISKGSEVAYQADLAKKRARAAEIRAALFPLAGGSKIKFEDALRFAQEASKFTNIRPAFLLAIVTQESNLGANVGSCYVTDLNTGDGVGKNTGTFYERVMYAKPAGDTTRRPSDTVPFKSLADALGMDWKVTPVSCPIDVARKGDATKYYVGRGFGGGMGASQFIPSTWMIYAGRVSKLFGNVPSNPWNPEHAFTASALYLSELGAVSGSVTSEIRAACSYYGTAGSTCTYGRQVNEKVSAIQNNINALQGF